MNKHAEMLCFMVGTGIEIHSLIREKGPVQRSNGEGKQRDSKLERWSKCACDRTHLDHPRPEIRSREADAGGVAGWAIDKAVS